MCGGKNIGYALFSTIMVWYSFGGTYENLVQNNFNFLKNIIEKIGCHLNKQMFKLWKRMLTWSKIFKFFHMLGFNILQSLLKMIRYKQVKTSRYEYNIKGKLPPNKKEKWKKKKKKCSFICLCCLWLRSHKFMHENQLLLWKIIWIDFMFIFYTFLDWSIFKPLRNIIDTTQK
jgi:hypothetical protein